MIKYYTKMHLFSWVKEYNKLQQTPNQKMSRYDEFSISSLSNEPAYIQRRWTQINVNQWIPTFTSVQLRPASVSNMFDRPKA